MKLTFDPMNEIESRHVLDVIALSQGVGILVDTGRKGVLLNTVLGKVYSWGENATPEAHVGSTVIPESSTPTAPPQDVRVSHEGLDSGAPIAEDIDQTLSTVAVPVTEDTGCPSLQDVQNAFRSAIELFGIANARTMLTLFWENYGLEGPMAITKLPENLRLPLMAHFKVGA